MWEHREGLDRCSAQTIANCFTKAGFIAGPLPEPEPAPPRNVWENIQWVLGDQHDDDVETCQPLTDAAIIEAVVGECDDGSADTDEPIEADGDDTDSNPDISRQPQEDEIIWTSAQFLRFVAQAKAYVLWNKLPQKATEALNVIEMLLNLLVKHAQNKVILWHFLDSNLNVPVHVYN